MPMPHAFGSHGEDVLGHGRNVGETFGSKTFRGILDLNMDLGTWECTSSSAFRVAVTRRLNLGSHKD